jgi:hypothetical protein
MKTPSRHLLALFATMTLAACATAPRPSAGTATLPLPEMITVAVGPCFGFCPVYSTTITPDGVVRFDGQRHTAVLGVRMRSVGVVAYRALARELTAFRPVSGTEAVVDCTAAVSDTSPFTVTWIEAAGHKTMATVQSGCPGGPGQALGELLRGLPDRLGTGEWAKQTTRPGTSRG